MLIIKYLNYKKEEKQIGYSENGIEEMGDIILNDILILLRSGGEILSINLE